MVPCNSKRDLVANQRQGAVEAGEDKKLHPSQDANTNVQNDKNRPPAPPAGACNVQHPSNVWLKSPAWIDGSINLPRFYYSLQEIDEVLIAAGVTPRTWQDQQAAHVTPAPSQAEPPAPLTPLLINTNEGHYWNIEAAVASVPKGHLVNITLIHPTVSTTATLRTKTALKKSKITKMDNIFLEPISRVYFIKAVLKIHSLADVFSPGIHSGPNFKLWWTGASGSKGRAPSIQNDHQFAVALTALLKKEKSKIQVSIEIDINDMEGFQIKQVLPPGVVDLADRGNKEELAYGTRVPQVKNFSELTQLHGHFIMELKKKWPCQQHQGEHGEPGFCYVTPTSEYIWLNLLYLKTWAVAMAAGDATKHEPPNVNVFDGARDGCIIMVKPQGHGGPASQLALSLLQLLSEALALLLSAFIPVLGGLSRKHGRSESPSPAVPSTPKRIKLPISTVDSPLPEDGFELCACLRDFTELEGIDLTNHEVPLRMEDYTPDIIPFIDNADLWQIMGTTSGVVIKLKLFCKEWFNRYKKKRHALK